MKSDQALSDIKERKSGTFIANLLSSLLFLFTSCLLPQKIVLSYLLLMSAEKPIQGNPPCDETAFDGLWRP